MEPDGVGPPSASQEIEDENDDDDEDDFRSGLEGGKSYYA
jgi:hypothetical protein